MDADAPEPIEVELVAHEAPPERGNRRRREPTDPTDGPHDETALDGVDGAVGEDGSDRNRLVRVAAVCAALALVLGWIIGRSTGGTDSVADDVPGATMLTTTTLAGPVETLPIVGEEIGSADFESQEPVASIIVGPTESVPTESETAEPGEAVAGPTTEPVGVDERLAGAPIRLVGVEVGGVLVEADLAAGTLTRFGADRVSTDGLPLVVGDDWVLASRFGRAAVVRSDGTVSEIDLGDRWDVLHVPGTELFWRASAEPRERDDAVVLSLVDLVGEPVGPTIELPAVAWPYAVDPQTGGVVVNGFPRNYVVRPDGVDYLGVGTLVALTPDVVVVHDCDEELQCSLLVVDRATGTATPVPIDPELDVPPALFAGRFGAPPQLSPDGRWVPVVDGWSSTTGIVELSTGRFVPLTDDPFFPTVVWSPDGRFAIVGDAMEIFAYDTVTDERFPVFTDTVRWVQLAVRPPEVGGPDPAASGPTLLSATPEEPVEG